MRYAIVRGNGITEDRIAAYLPSNYEVLGSHEDAVLIAGADSCGWTMDDYVLPRLASGLWFGTEIVGDEAIEEVLATTPMSEAAYSEAIYKFKYERTTA